MLSTSLCITIIVIVSTHCHARAKKIVGRRALQSIPTSTTIGSVTMKSIFHVAALFTTITVPFMTTPIDTAFAATTDALLTYKDTGNEFSFQYTDDLKLSPKPLQTHQLEIYMKSELIKGFSVGITGDKVKLPNIKDFTTPSGLAKKVEQVEMGKEGVKEVNILKAEEALLPLKAAEIDATDTSSIPLYNIEYKVDSTRGYNHYNVKATIYNSKLYVFTTQSKEDSFQELSPKIDQIMDSLVIMKRP